MNSVEISGNLARDPIVRSTKTGRAVATFTVASSRLYVSQNGEQKEQTAWINVVILNGYRKEGWEVEEIKG